MLDDEKYNEVLDSGLTLDHYMVLCNIKNGVKLLSNRRIQGFLNLLAKKDYIKDDTLTEKGYELVENCEFAQTIPVEIKEQTIDLTVWSAQLYEECRNKLLELRGTSQVRPKIKGRAYSFMPNSIDFGKKIVKVVTKYNLKDLPAIKRTILAFIEKRNTENYWFPLLQYYIFKEDVSQSQLVTDLEEPGEESNNNKQFEIIKNKDLFE